MGELCEVECIPTHKKQVIVLDNEDSLFIKSVSVLYRRCVGVWMHSKIVWIWHSDEWVSVGELCLWRRESEWGQTRSSKWIIKWECEGAGCDYLKLRVSFFISRSYNGKIMDSK